MGIAALEIAAFLKVDGVGTCVWSNLDAPPPEARSSFQYSQVFLLTLLQASVLFFMGRRPWDVAELPRLGFSPGDELGLGHGDDL